VRALRWLLPVGISATAIWLVLRDVAWNQFIDNLRKIPPGTYLLASVIFFAGLFFRVFCWYILLGRRVSFKDTFFTMNAGYLLNNIFPFRLGEIGRAILLDSPEGPSALEVLSSILVERILDVFLAAVFVLSMLPRIFSTGYDPRLIVIALVFALVGISALFLMARFRGAIGGWLGRWGMKANFIRKWVAPKADQLLNGLAVFDRPLVFLLAFSSLTLSWGLAFLMNYVVFRQLYPHPPFWWLVFVLSAGAFGAALPSAPAALGVFEGVIVAAFALLGVGQGVAFTYAVVIHAIQFVFSNILGLIGLRLRGQAVIDLYHRATHRSTDVPEVSQN
jgi:hypothetical protein